MNQSESPCHFQTEFPSAEKWGSEVLLIYDRVLEKTICRSWIRRFPIRYAVTSGEKMKSVEMLPQHIRKIQKLTAHAMGRNMTIVVLGGGSVGDFGAFVASIWKRGVRLIMIPSTWLSAIDSAHGGKTALNVVGVKNQIGTFYPAHEIYLIRRVLMTQPSARIKEAWGEVLKTALIQGGALWAAVQNHSSLDSKTLWRLLPKLIESKYKVVRKDPFEEKGLRYILNFGHTFGHVFESYYNYPHGLAVLDGIGVALWLSHQHGEISSQNYDKILQTPAGRSLPSQEKLRVLIKNVRGLRQILIQDKKLTSHGMMNFVLLKRPGYPVVRKINLQRILDTLKAL